MTTCPWSVNVSRPASPIRAQRVVGERLGGDHQRVDGRDAPRHPGSVPVQPSVATTTFAAEIRRPSASTTTRSAVRCTCAPSTMRPAEPTHRRGQAADEPARVDPGAVRGERRAAGPGDVEPLAGGRGIEPGRAVVPRRRVRGGDPGPGLLRRGAGHDQRPALDEAGAQALLGGDPAHLVDRVAQRGQLGQRWRLRPYRRVERVGADRQQRRHQPPLRPLAPKPTCSASSTSTSAPGLLSQQVVGGPQPGVAAADHDDVRGLRQLGRGRPGRRRGRRGGVPPQRPGRRSGVSPATSEVVLGLGEHASAAAARSRRTRPGPIDQRRRELDDRVAAVVGAAVQPGVEQRLGQEAAQQPLALVVVERLAGLPCP